MTINWSVQCNVPLTILGDVLFMVTLVFVSINKIVCSCELSAMAGSSHWRHFDSSFLLNVAVEVCWVNVQVILFCPHFM